MLEIIVVIAVCILAVGAAIFSWRIENGSEDEDEKKDKEE